MDLSKYLDKIKRAIEKSPLISKYANLLHEKTNVSPEIFVVAFGLILVFMLFFDICAGAICDVIAYGYPFYQSIKCIESKEKDDDKQWLVYWVVFGILGCLETFIHIITYWIPFYYPLKLTFLIWCMHPSYCGATVIYNKVLKDLVDTHMDKIDDIINNPSALLKTDDTKKD